MPHRPHLRSLLSLLSLAASAAACSSAGSNDGALRGAQGIVVADCSSATAWSEPTPYAVGSLVTYGGSTYSCIQAHTSEPGWTPDVVPALWGAVTCESGSGGSASSGSDASGGGSASSSGSSSGASSGTTSSSSTCDASAWVYMGSDANACSGHVGESCGWTNDNEGQGYHCQAVSWGVGCESGGASCPVSTGAPSSGSSSGGSSTSGSSTGGGSTSGGSSGGGSSTSTGSAPKGLIFSPYKDMSINLNWDTNVATTDLSGSPTALASDLAANGGKTITLAFATGECGSENFGGVEGATMASANVPFLTSAGVDYIVSTGGAAGSFTCGSDAGFETFVGRWASSNLVGVDFDIEAGQSQAVITALVQRIQVAHGVHPGLRFSLTLATLANNDGASSAQSLGGGAPDSFNVYGDEAIAAANAVFGGAWPSYLTFNLMTMDYGSPTDGVCVVSGGACQMGQSAIQAAYNLHDHWGVPYGNIELTPMIGGNDSSSETFTLSDVDAISHFAIANGLAGIHYWSYDRDTDCAPGSASPTCNTVGGVGAHGYLKRFLADGLH